MFAIIGIAIAEANDGRKEIDARKEQEGKIGGNGGGKERMKGRNDNKGNKEEIKKGCKNE